MQFHFDLFFLLFLIVFHLEIIYILILGSLSLLWKGRACGQSVREFLEYVELSDLLLVDVT